MCVEPGQPEYLQALNPQQRQAVLHAGRPLLILAGAGSGKTRVITTKIAYLIDRQGFEPHSILAVAFTNKAAEEMRERVRSLSPAGAEVMIKTFHAFGAWLLRRFGSRFTIYDDEDSFSLLKNVLKDEPGGSRLSQAQVKELSGWIARAKDLCLLPGDDLKLLSSRAGAAGVDFPGIYRLYQQRLEQTGSLDFGDLIVQPVRLLQGNPEIRGRMRERFRAILVDEYQDSNFAQFRLLRELHGEEGYLCVVGDEDQSIYSFRGAELENILGFSGSFPGTEVIRLEENYRSSRNILEVATAVVAHNRHRLGKKLWTRKPEGPPVVLAYHGEPDDEALFCAEKLRDGRLAESAVLYRMNFQSRVFESLFSRLGIPYRVVGTVRFYEREEVKDALAYLSLLVNPCDELAFRRAVGRPRRGVGARSLERILRQPRGEGGVLAAASEAAAGLGGKAASGLSSFLALLDRLRSLLEAESGEALSRVVHRLIMESGLVDHYRERDEAEGTDRVRNLEELVNATTEYPGTLAGLNLYLETLLLGGGEEDPFRSTGQVTLITAHNTKGLEFDRVFITGLEDGIFPHYASTAGGVPAAGAELEEERRLFYVAVTRARQELYLTSCRQRRVFGVRQARQPSCFLAEIPPQSLSVYGSPGEREDGFPLGCLVYHEDYGPGIISRKWEAEGLVMAAVRFDSGKLARFPLKFSRLERISRDP